MVEHSRYHVSKKNAGIGDDVLKNKLGIKDQKKLDDAETILLADTYTHFFDLLEKDEIKFDLSLLFLIHQYFFEPLYSWAGKKRRVNLSKDGILFASVRYIDSALDEFDKLLKKELPKITDTKKEVSQKLTTIHSDFNAIHPFREGNGRTVRLFLDLIAHSLGYDFIEWNKKTSKEYIRACVEGVKGDNSGMNKIIKAGLKKTV